MSSLPVRTCLPSGEKATELMVFECPNWTTKATRCVRGCNTSPFGCESCRFRALEGSGSLSARCACSFLASSSAPLAPPAAMGISAAGPRVAMSLMPFGRWSLASSPQPRRAANTIPKPPASASCHRPTGARSFRFDASDFRQWPPFLRSFQEDHVLRLQRALRQQAAKLRQGNGATFFLFCA